MIKLTVAILKKSRMPFLTSKKKNNNNRHQERGSGRSQARPRPEKGVKKRRRRDRGEARTQVSIGRWEWEWYGFHSARWGLTARAIEGGRVPLLHPFSFLPSALGQLESLESIRFSKDTSCLHRHPPRQEPKGRYL
jgi:hypothetical protein